MDKELQDYYETLLDLFASKGWKQYVEDISDNMELLQDITTIPMRSNSGSAEDK